MKNDYIKPDDENVLGKGIEAIFARTARFIQNEKTLDLPNGIVQYDGDELIIRLQVTKDTDIRKSLEELAEMARNGLLDQLVNVDKFKGMIREHLEMYELALEEDDTLAAIDELKSILKTTELPDVRYNLAVLFEKMNKPDIAIRQYIKALKTQPKDIATMNNLGRLLYDRGNFSEAMDYYQKMLQLDPALSDKGKDGGLFAPRFGLKKLTI